jgi:hypothetical protein
MSVVPSRAVGAVLVDELDRLLVEVDCGGRWSCSAVEDVTALSTGFPEQDATATAAKTSPSKRPILTRPGTLQQPV